jgi:hypothetical protein
MEQEMGSRPGLLELNYGTSVGGEFKQNFGATARVLYAF